MNIRYIWDEEKRALNLETHGLDFADAPGVFLGPTFTFEDARFDNWEERFVTLGVFDSWIVSIVHTEYLNTLRVISFRKATKREQALYFEQVQD
jgi:uncharacterized DUF497 family protein